MKRKLITKVLSAVLAAGMIFTSVPYDVLATEIDYVQEALVEEAVTEETASDVTSDISEEIAETVVEVVEEPSETVEVSADNGYAATPSDKLTANVQSIFGYDVTLSAEKADFPNGTVISAEEIFDDTELTLEDAIRAEFKIDKNRLEYAGYEVEFTAPEGQAIDENKTFSIDVKREEIPEYFIDAEVQTFVIDKDNNIRQLVSPEDYTVKVSEVAYIFNVIAFFNEGDNIDPIIEDEIDVTSKGGSGLIRPFAVQEYATIPSYYRNTDLPALRNQNPLGSCFSHSSTAIGEINAIKKGYANAATVNYSEKHLCYFNYHYNGSTMDPLGNTAGDTSAKQNGEWYNGGNVTYTSPILAGWSGHAEESADSRYVYNVVNKALTDDLNAGDTQNDASHLQGYYIASTQNDRAKVKEMIMKYGAAAVSYYDADAYYNSTNNCFYNYNNTSTNHAVTCVGWDDNFSKDNFGDVKPDGDGAWLIRNSWWYPSFENNPRYSKESHYGYFWLSYYDTSLRDAAYFFDEEPADNYDNNYQYDGSPSGGFISSYGTCKAANVFKAVADEEGETIEAASFVTGEANVNYKVTVYTGLTAANRPESGVKGATVSGTTDCEGYYTVKFPTPAEVDNGDLFSIVVELSKSGDSASIGYEYSLTGWITTKASAGANQSFTWNGSSWSDFGKANNRNIRIKAFTTNSGSSVGKYIVKYDANGGTGKMDPERFTVGTAGPLAECAYKADDAQFAGWSLEKDNPTVIYQPGDTIESFKDKQKNDVVTLYAQWNDDYRVIYDANGGSGDNMPDQSVKYGNALPLSACTYTMRSRTFAGWSLERDDMSDLLQPGDLLSEKAPEFFETIKRCGTVTLYAQWNKPLTVDVTHGAGEWPEGTGIGLYSNPVGADIYYTTDGTTPNPDAVVSEGEAGTHLFIDDIILKANEDVTKDKTIYIKAMATMAGCNDSTVSTFGPFTVKGKTDAALWGDVVDEDKPIWGSSADAWKNVPAGIWTSIEKVESVPYKGSAVTFDNLRVYKGTRLLSEGNDYTVKYVNNIKASTETSKAAFVVTGKNNYSGTYSKTFEITALSLEDNAKAVKLIFGYNGRVQKGVPVVKYNLNGTEIVLKKNTDYTLEYPQTELSAYKEAGTYTITVKGKGNYTGEISVDEVIYADKKPISKVTVTGLENQVFERLANGKGRAFTVADMPEFTVSDRDGVVSDSNYTLEYENNDVAGTASIYINATEDGDYYGSKKVTFKIAGIQMKKVQISGITALEYNNAFGDEGIIHPDLLVSYEGEPLVKSLDDGETGDYVISYAKNKKAGTASAAIKGVNGYTGTIKKTFRIIPKKMDNYIISYHYAGVDSNIEVTEYTYAKGGVKPGVMVIDTNGNHLVQGVDYTVSYKNNKIVADDNDIKAPTVVVKGKGNYSGTLNRTFKINNGDMSSSNILVQDVVFSNKAGNCKPSFTITDYSGAKLGTGDYDKNVKYQYVDDTVVTHKIKEGRSYIYESVYKEAGTEVDMRNDIVPAGTSVKLVVSSNPKGKFEGENWAIYRVTEKSIAKATVKINLMTAYSNGDEIRLPKSGITVLIGRKPIESNDFTIESYTNNVNKGTATIVLRGIGNYGGYKKVTFKINAQLLNEE